MKIIKKVIQCIRNYFYVAFHAFALLAHVEELSWENENAEGYVQDLHEQIHALRADNEHLSTRCHSRKNTILSLFRSLSGCELPIGMAKRMYEVMSSEFDQDGAFLYAEAKKVWGVFHFEAHLENWGLYDGATDREMYQFLFEDVYEWSDEFDTQEDLVYRNALVMMGLLEKNQYTTPVKRLPPLICCEDVAPGQAKQIYLANARKMDTAGYELFHEAELILGKFDEMEFYYEANTGKFEDMDGNTKLHYLLVQYQHKLGTRNHNRWEIVPANTPTEQCIDFSMEVTPEFRKFEQALYENVCRKLGLMYPKAVMEAELRLRKQESDAGEDLGYRKPLVPADYSDEAIRTALEGNANAA